MRCLIAFSVVLLTSACASSEAPVPTQIEVEAQSSEADEQAVREALEQLEASWNAGDLATNMTYVDNDGFQLPPNEAGRIGKAALQASWEEFLAANNSEWHPVVEDIWVSGDLALVRGRFRETITPKDGGEVEEVDDKAAWALRRGADGQWRLLMEVWNPDRPTN